MSGLGGPDDGAEEALIFVENHIELIRRQLPTGESLKQCDECGNDIPEARRLAMPGCKFCIECQEIYDRLPKPKIKTVTYMP